MWQRQVQWHSGNWENDKYGESRMMQRHAFFIRTVCKLETHLTKKSILEKNLTNYCILDEYMIL